PRQHPRQAMLLTTEPDEHRPMRCRSAKRRIPPEDVPLLAVLYHHRPRDMRRRAAYIFIQFNTGLLGPADDFLLLCDWERFEGGGAVDPLLPHEHPPPRARRSVRNQAHLWRLRERGILGSIKKAREAAALFIGPARHFCHEARNGSERPHGFARHIIDRG